MKVTEKLRRRKVILIVILVGLLVSCSGVYALNILSKDILYDNTSSKLTSTNVQGAIDELYNSATDKIESAKKECPAGKVCKNPICISATTLHEGENGITFGTIPSGTLKTGDAFNCDVNGDNIYDEETERFYYVTELENNSNVGVLIYYNNVTNGVANNTTAYQYDKSGNNNNGPVTAIEQLPKTTQWSNINLKNDLRKIITESGGASTSSGNLPASFSYAGYSARFLTAKEVKSSCGITVGDRKTGELDVCKFLLENTSYENTNFKNGYWLENPNSSTTMSSWYVFGYGRNFSHNNVSNDVHCGVRPVIEVSKFDILIQ